MNSFLPLFFSVFLLVLTPNTALSRLVWPEDNEKNQTRADNSYTPYIVGGSSIENPARYPYYTAINKITSAGPEFKCGGTLIHPNWVLTAAHCITEDQEYQLEIGSGVFGKEMKKLIDIRDVKPKNACIHPKRDLALLYFDDPSEKQPVSLSDRMTFGLDDDLSLIGLGSTHPYGKGELPSRLQVAKVHYVRRSKCRRQWDGYDVKWSRTICATGNGVNDACMGDSGGPLFFANRKNDPSKDKQIAVVSFGMFPCNDPENPPVVYARLHLRWITRVLEKGYCFHDPK